MSESSRLSFYLQRDGLEATIEFAARTMRLYRKCVLQSRKRGFYAPHHASLPEYRKSFILSYLVLKKFLSSHNHN